MQEGSWDLGEASDCPNRCPEHMMGGERRAWSSGGLGGARIQHQVGKQNTRMGVGGVARGRRVWIRTGPGVAHGDPAAANMEQYGRLLRNSAGRAGMVVRR